MAASQILGRITFAAGAAALVAVTNGTASAQENGQQAGACLIADAGPENGTGSPCFVNVPPEMQRRTGAAMTPLSLGFPDDLRGDSTAFEDMAVGLFNRSRKERQAWVDDASSGELRQWRLAVVNWIAGIEDGDPRELYVSAIAAR